jgi:hypothetical protein
VAEVALPLSHGTRHLVLEVAAAGAALGIVGQILRQVPGQTMQFGAATAPWLSIGFALAVFAARKRAAGRVLAVYLVTWLVAYHVLFALGQSVAFSAAFREAAPWLVLALPVCAILSPTANLATRSTRLGDACVALSLAWSLPEALENVRRGDTLVAAAIALLALTPAVATKRRDIRLLTVVISTLVLGGLALLVGPVARGLIGS